MSASPSSRDLARNKPHRPSTPDQTWPPNTRTGSYSVAPKSEYLRNALQARRAHQPTTPSSRDRRAAPSSASKPLDTKTLRTSPDIFDEFALSEEQTAPVSPIRRRRPSDVGMPRNKTSRELTNEIEHLKNNLITSNVRVELLKKNNSELQHEVTKLREKVEEVDMLKDENHELHEENNHLKLKLQEMDEEVAQLRDENDTLRTSNEEMLSINVECSTHWEDQELAVQEAADTIIALETEKAALVGEVLKMKERVSALEDDSSRASTLVDGSPRCPSRVYSIDESRPSTSHFDSDYYSQSESPYVKTSRESVSSITPSERTRKFLDLSQERRRSARDLAKRMSAASLKALRIKSSTPVPEVPEIPEVFQQQVPQIIERMVVGKEPDMSSTDTSPKQAQECDPIPQSSPSDPCYFNSQIDLTSEVDPDDKDRWWRSVARLNPPQQYNIPQRIPSLPRSQSHAQTHPDVPGQATQPDTNGTCDNWPRSMIKSDVRKTRTQPSTPAATTPYVEKKDFMFNPAEDVDTFMRKAKSRLSRQR
ncbi:hypothetical protein GQ44DRAFT_736526 [Phaeosphaeriaceae sp. PMI808]|nr:hypothetical protein GQ44DRAFT_736526 [Phaeosphaeriaceae sp. PMI808]